MGIVGARREREKRRVCRMRAVGTVTGVSRKKRFEDGEELELGYDCPVVTFRAGETSVEDTYVTGSAKVGYQVGDTLEVFYNPDDPKQYFIDHFTGLMLYQVYIRTGGVMFGVLAVLVLILITII